VASEAGREINWVTPEIAVGCAPLSFNAIEELKKQGIDAVVNLCGEFCDLHLIEAESGLDVYFLPVADESVPDMEEMERALDWVDKRISKGKKVLIHCRHGIGRTGTFVTAYLIRHGLGLKAASKELKGTRACPTSFSQWQLLRRYEKRAAGADKPYHAPPIAQKAINSDNIIDISPYLTRYERIVREADLELFRTQQQRTFVRCGMDSVECCKGYFEVGLIEAIYIQHKIPQQLSMMRRFLAARRASRISSRLEKARAHAVDIYGPDPAQVAAFLAEVWKKEGFVCPLVFDSRCGIFHFRPLRCRAEGVPEDAIEMDEYRKRLFCLSQELFEIMGGCRLDRDISFPVSDVISGRFIQDYIDYATSMADAMKQE